MVSGGCARLIQTAFLINQVTYHISCALDGTIFSRRIVRLSEEDLRTAKDPVMIELRYRLACRAQYVPSAPIPTPVHAQ